MKKYRYGNLRWRLTVWYGSVFLGVLFLYVVVATFFHYKQLRAQIYHGEIQDIEASEGLLFEASDGSVHLNEQYFNQPEMPMRLERLFEVMDENGKMLFRNSRLGSASIEGNLFSGEGRGSYNERVGRLSDGRSVFIISHVHRLKNKTYVLRLAYERMPVLANVREFALVLFMLIPLMIVVAGCVVYQITGAALSPLTMMVRRANQITAEKLNERLPLHTEEDELAQTARAFNDMLQRIEESFLQLKRFTADASHELRTPLSSLRSMGEVCLHQKHTVAEYRDVIASMLEEGNRLTRLVDSLLVISRADSGQIVLDLQEIDLYVLLMDVLSLVEVLAEEKQQRLNFEYPEHIYVRVDYAILRQAVLNVLDNAIKYSPPASQISISLLRIGSNLALIRIQDEGSGIPENLKEKIFDRFYRIDEGRSAGSGGYGLGLAIAKWAVEINQGKIRLNPSFQCGACFEIHLPVASEGNLSV